MFRILMGVLALLLFGTSPAHAEWRRAESPNFVLFGNLSESQLRQRILLLEDFDRLLRSITTDVEPPAENKLHVYIVNGRDDLDVLRRLPPGTAGLYTATLDGIAAFVDGNQEAGNFILFHEYVHHFMLQNSHSAYPAWYVEGFAEYFSTARFAARMIDIGRYDAGRAYAILEQRWLPMERLLSGGPMGLSRDNMAVYYAQSWLLTHYFYSTPERQAALLRLLAALRRDPPAEALRAATGFSFDQLDAELRRYIRGGRISYRQMERPSNSAVPAVSITRLPRSAGDMILFEGLLRIGIGEDDMAAMLPRIRAAAARYPDDQLAMRVLAHAEVLYGDAAAGERVLDRLLVQTPNDAHLLYLKGMRYLMLAESDDPPARAGVTARTWFTRAHRADANHYQTLYRFAQSLNGEPEFLSENTRNVLLLARQLAPQVPTITMNAASLLIARREYAAAITYLAPLAANPHDTGLADAARQMITQAQARLRDSTSETDENSEPSSAD